jgi:hypothetical protein
MFEHPGFGAVRILEQFIIAGNNGKKPSLTLLQHETLKMVLDK